MIIVIDDCIIANCTLYGNLSFPLSLSVTHHSSPSICSPPFMPLCSRTCSCTCSLAGPGSMLRASAARLPQQPRPGCVLPLQRHRPSLAALPQTLLLLFGPTRGPSGRRRERARGRRVIDASASICRQVNGAVVEVISVFPC